MIADTIKSTKRKLLCLEVNPPRGTDLEPVFARLEKISSLPDFFNVTDSALAKMRMSPVPFAAKLKERFGVEPLVNFSCRDRNLIAIQGDLLAGWALGVRSIIALTGDAVSVGDAPERKAVFEVNSVGLLQAIQKLNAGQDFNGHPLKGAPSYFPGVVVNPNARNPEAEVKKLQKKKDAGAGYALSQPVFDLDQARRFFDIASRVELPIFLGLMGLKDGHAALALNNVPGIKISDSIRLAAEADVNCDLGQSSINLALDLARDLKQYVVGYHVIAGSSMQLALELLGELDKLVKA